jgi:hypothetical protein
MVSAPNACLVVDAAEIAALQDSLLCNPHDSANFNPEPVFAVQVSLSLLMCGRKDTRLPSHVR